MRRPTRLPNTSRPSLPNAIANPRDDLVTSLVQASDGGDRLDATELFSMIGGLLFAGYDTTRNQLGLAMVLFSEHPDQWRLLAQDPALVPRQ